MTPDILPSSGRDPQGRSRRRRLPAVGENATNERPRHYEVRLVMAVNDGGVPPILAQKHDTQPSAFAPENLLRDVRTKKRIASSSVRDALPSIAIAAGRLRSRLLR